MNKKHMKIAAIVFAVWYIVSKPEGAAGLVNSSLDGLDTVAQSFMEFMSTIAS